ncbi:hypothetical protein [Paractinoplanes globisporus]|uniref:Uncharacterized protein n=1 Tax=Paractinoplanes globisporus TaxID=113565 RepID=A0ABW6WLV6_9ACTN|nr:hypothetical protein [Actinoplanes globisporus]
MTAVVPRPRIAMRFVVEGPPIGALWRRALLRAALVPLVVLAPIVALAPTADHKYNVYWHGGLFRDDPLRIVPHTLDALPGYLRNGNFRPLGRMLEKLVDLAAYTLGDIGLPANVGLRVVSIAAAMLLGVTALVLVEGVVGRGRLFRSPPSTVAASVPFAMGAVLVAAGRSSPVVLFGGLYFTTAALVLLVATAVARTARVRLWLLPPLLVAGAALAAFNELTYLALPLATVAAVARGRWVLARTWREVLTGAPMRALAALWIGFLPVFVVVRVVIQRYCGAGPCYHGSEVAVGSAVAKTFPVRLVAWFPPLEWQSAVRGGGALSGLVLVLALAALAMLAWTAVRDLRRLAAVDRPAAGALVVVAFALIALGAGLASLSSDVQQLVAAHRWGQGWRDTAVVAPGGALLLVAAAHLTRPRRLLLGLLIAVLVAGSAVSATANKRFRDTVMESPIARLDDRLAQEVVDFDPTPAGAVRRCALRDEFFALNPGGKSLARRFDTSLDTAARQRAGQPFCPVTR